MLDTFLLALFSKYAELLKRRFSEDFQEVCSYSCGFRRQTRGANLAVDRLD